ncbi:MAG: insulinase family protein [Candidatus Krumholzibacteriota bacterium]|nr:insulinase family protein [Candidatus Krumholzibacteriota bacterium]
MKRKVLIGVLAVVLAIALATPLLAGKRKHPSDLKYPQLDITTPEVIDISLDNGLEGFLIEDQEIPVVDVVILIKTYFPDPEKYGLNEMVNWVIRNGGSRDWPSDKLNDELEFLPASVEIYGGSLNSIIAASCMKKDLAQVLSIMSDLIMNPLFPEDKIEKKRNDMLEEIRRQNDQPGDIARREFMKILYQDHPYGWESTTATVSAVMRDDLVDFHRTYFHPNNAILGVSGDVTRAEIEKALNLALSGWERAEVDIPPVPEVKAKPAESYHYAYKDINQAYIMIGHLGINSNNPDHCAVNIMNFILGGGSFTSWITEEVRVKKGLAYSTGSRYGQDAFAVGPFYAYSRGTKADEYSRAINIIMDQITRMKTVGPTEEELRKAVDSFLNGQVFDYDSKSGMVRRLVGLRFEGRPLDTPEMDMETYAKLTVEEIRRAADKYLLRDKLSVLVVGDKDQFDRPLSDFGEVQEIELKTE